MGEHRVEMDQIVAQLTPEDDNGRRSGVLRPLNWSLIGLSVLGLLIMVVNGANSSAYLIILGSLALNLLVAALDRTGHTTVAVHLFAHWINAGILTLVALNLFSDGTLVVGVIFCCVLAMSVILAGILLGARMAFVFAGVDAAFVFGFLLLFFRSAAQADERGPVGNAISTAVPIAALLLIVAVISWLYQRALAESERKVSLARQRILRDELIRRDLAIARELQQRLYPPPPLTDANIRIASRSEPARETSGDFYDFIPIGDGRLGIVVADVTGKSLAAALVMAMARGTLRSEATRHSDAAAVLRSANQTLCQDHSVKQMITAFYGVLDPRALTLQISNAGHPFPMLRRNGQIEEIEICGLPLGARPDALYTETTVQLQPGDQLVILSDGLLEEHNAGRELFGFERLAAAVAAASDTDPEHALDDIWQAVARFRGDTEQSDDITLVVLQIAPALQLPAAAPRQPASQDA